MPTAEVLITEPAAGSEPAASAAPVPSARVLWSVAAVLLVLTWPVRTQIIRVGVDGSWLTGLPMAAHERLRFGHDLVFTYGPLGFLGSPFRYPLSGVLALVAQGAVRALVLAVCLRVLVRLVPLPLAALLAGVLVTALDPSLTTSVVALALGGAVAALLARRRPPRAVEAALCGTGVGVLGLVKADAGVVVLVVVAAAVVLAAGLGRGWRAAPAAAAWLAAGVATGGLAGWLATGQRLGDLVPWARGTASMASGYTSAMAIGGNLPFGIGAVVAAVAVAVALLVRSNVERPWRVAALVVALGGLYLSFRQGFVRFDPEHSRQTYAAVFAVVLGVSAAGAAGRRAVLGALAAVSVLYLPGQVSAVDKLVDVDTRLRGAADSVRLVAQPSFRGEYVSWVRSQAAGSFAVPERMLARIGTGTVHVVPWSILVAYSHPQLRWAPLPVFQDYAVHTTYLDDRNVAGLRSGDGPEFVLRDRNESIDDKLPQFEPPAQNLELVCRYRVVASDVRWELLQRGPSRCGAVPAPTTVDARFGAPVTIPAADDAVVVARFTGVGTSLVDRVRAAVFRGPDLYAGTGRAWYRFVPGHQSSWHVLRVPDCARSAVGPDLVDVAALTMSDRAGPSGRGDGYTVELARIPYRCPTR